MMQEQMGYRADMQYETLNKEAEFLNNLVNQQPYPQYEQPPPERPESPQKQSQTFDVQITPDKFIEEMDSEWNEVGLYMIERLSRKLLLNQVYFNFNLDLKYIKHHEQIFTNIFVSWFEIAVLHNKLLSEG